MNTGPTVPPWRGRLLGLAILAAAMTLALTLTALVTDRLARERLAEQNGQTLDLYVANIHGTLQRFEALPELLGYLPEVQRLFQQPDNPATVAVANRLLERVQGETGADTLYLMNPDGDTLAASNWATPVSFVGRNFAFRPYFQEALAGRLGTFFGLGTTSAKRGYYFASAVHGNGGLLGVAVVKVDLDGIEGVWGSTSPEQVLVTDRRGVVILTSDPSWRFTATRPLTAQERAESASNLPYPQTEPPPIELNRDAYLAQSRTLDPLGWTVTLLAPRYLISGQVQSAMLAAGTGVLLLALLVLLIGQRRRHYLERIAMETHGRHRLEERVRERTLDLENLNERLKREVLERQHAQDELQRMQDELIQAGKLSALGTMSASISHELNQPLGAMRTYAENGCTLLDHQRPDDARRNLTAIVQLTGHMASIIANLRAFARREQRAAVNVDLVDALRETLSQFQPRLAQESVQLVVDLPAHPVWVQAGVSRLRQVLANLISNALDAMHKRDAPRLQVALLHTGPTVELILDDNGEGLDEAALERAFDPFFTTKSRTEGLGLGLAICRGIVESLGGRLLLENRPSGGARARLVLLSTDAANSDTPAEAQA